MAMARKNVASHQKKKNDKTGKRERQEKKRENIRPPSERPRLPFSRSESSTTKNGLYESSAWGDEDPQKGPQPFRPNPNGVGDRTTTLRWLLIGAAPI